MADNIKYYLQRWRLAFQGIISRIIGQRWLRILWGFISARVVSSLGQRWWLTISSIISRDEDLLFKVSSPEMKACYSRYHLQSRWSEMTTFIMRCHLQRWRLGKQGIISAKVVSEMTAYSIKYHLQRWQSDFQGIISRDEGLPLTVSSLESLDKHDYVYYKVSSPEMTAGKTRYNLC